MAVTIPGVKGTLGNTDYYQATMKARELIESVRPASELDEWTTMSIEERLQREPDIDRIKEQIAPYLATAKDRFFGSVIVLVYKGEIYFESIKDWMASEAPISFKLIGEKVGIITIDGGSLIMLDGQHRLLALEQVIKGYVTGKYRDDVSNDEICVIFIKHETNEKTRRIFNRVNRYAKPTSRSDNIITSEDDVSAIIARKLLNEGAPLGIKINNNNDLIVEWKNNTLAARSLKLTTISVVYETVKLILKSHNIPIDPSKCPSEEKLEEYYNLAEFFWNTVLDNMPPYKQAIKDSSRIPEMRKEEYCYSLLFRAIPQITLFKGLVAATQNNRLSLEEAVQRSAKIDWCMTSKMWKNIFVNPNGTMLKGQKNQNLGARVIEYLIAADKMEEDEIEMLQREYNDAHGLDVDSSESLSLPNPVILVNS